jgi:hypothetical protein
MNFKTTLAAAAEIRKLTIKAMKCVGRKKP